MNLLSIQQEAQAQERQVRIPSFPLTEGKKQAQEREIRIPCL